MAKTKKPAGGKRPRREPLEKESEKKVVKEPEKKTEDKRPLPELPLTESEKKAQDQSSTGSSTESSPPGTEEEEILIDQEDIFAICKEIPDLLFQVWKRFDPKIELLDEGAKKRIAKPLARIAQKKDFAKYMKDEFYLILILGFEISKRVKIKKHVKDNSGEKGPGKNEPGHGVH